MMTPTDTQKAWRHDIERELDRRLPPPHARPETLHRAMRTSVLAGGKRIRPLFCMASAAAVGGRPDDALTSGLALEVLHTYTLIHDDLPAMDDDDLRRGRPTCHKEFGEAIAILAGDALLTLAFEWLAEAPVPPPWPAGRLALELADAAGSKGIIAGQVEDMAAEGRPPEENTLAYIHLHKTAALFRAAARMGGISGGGDPDAVETLGECGCDIGQAFQYVDDILNATGRREDLGKGTGTDRERGKITSVALYGVEGARRRAAEYVDRGLCRFASRGTEPSMLESLARQCLDRLA